MPPSSKTGGDDQEPSAGKTEPQNKLREKNKPKKILPPKKRPRTKREKR
jgi:hypothetical protein